MDMPLRFRPSPRFVQRQFPFRDRVERLDRTFRRGIAAATLALLAALVAAAPTGRDAVRRLGFGVRLVTRRVAGLPTPREEIDADWAAWRARGVASASAYFRRAFDEAPPDVRRLLRFAGMGRDDALVRWGNYDQILVLPSAVFAPDDSGRSYRFRPNIRSVWLRGVGLPRGLNGFFLVPDTPGLADVLRGTTACVVPGTAQSTNSWGCRGPEPDPSAPLRGVVLGDSSMQGYFVADDETPPYRLAVEIENRLGTRVSILNTGHLGYSTEQYYHTLVEYAPRLRPHFVVVAPCANDFGPFADVVADRGDWEEARYWLGQIQDYCRTRGILCITASVPYDTQVAGRRRVSSFPGRVEGMLGLSSVLFCDPTDELVDEFLRLRIESERSGTLTSPNPLYNLHLDDHHFSPLGSTAWARAVGRRLAGLLDLQRARHALSF